MKRILLMVFTFIFFNNLLYATLESELSTINSQILQKEGRIRSLEAELSRLLAESRGTESEDQNTDNESFYSGEGDDNHGGDFASEESEDFFFEEMDPSARDRVKQSIASEKSFESNEDDRRVAQGAQSVYEGYLREQEEKRIAMQEFAAGMESVGMGLQQVQSQYQQSEAQLAQMAAANRKNVATAMNSYSNAYNAKMESSGYNDWKKSVTAQANGQTYKSNYNNGYKSNNSGGSNYNIKTTKPTVNRNLTRVNSSSNNKQTRNWWIMCEVKGNNKGTLKSTNYYLKQSNSSPRKQVTRTSMVGIASGPYTHSVAQQKLRQVNSSPLKMNIKTEKDAQKQANDLKQLMMKNPEFRKKYLKNKAEMGF